MIWDVIGAVAEGVAALAVLASLVYLARQIRHNSSTVDSATEDGVVSGFNEINLLIGSDSSLTRIFTVGLSEPEQLSNDEVTQFSFLFSSYINQYNRLFVLHNRGSFGTDRWQMYATELAYLLSTPGGSAWKEGNPNFEDLWEAVSDIPISKRIDMTMDSITRRDA